MDQPGKVANRLVVSCAGKKIFPCLRSRLRSWSRETGSAVPSRVSLLISTLGLNLVLRPIVVGKRRTKNYSTEMCSILCSRRPQKNTKSHFMTTVMAHKKKRSFGPLFFSVFRVSSISIFELKSVCIIFSGFTRLCGHSMTTKSPCLFPTYSIDKTDLKVTYQCRRKVSYVMSLQHADKKILTETVTSPRRRIRLALLLVTYLDKKGTRKTFGTTIRAPKSGF